MRDCLRWLTERVRSSIWLNAVTVAFALGVRNVPDSGHGRESQKIYHHDPFGIRPFIATPEERIIAMDFRGLTEEPTNQSLNTSPKRCFEQ
jgi:hypothetical protein